MNIIFVYLFILYLFIYLFICISLNIMILYVLYVIISILNIIFSYQTGCSPIMLCYYFYTHVTFSNLLNFNYKNKKVDITLQLL